jgi:hypothetical protein
MCVRAEEEEELLHDVWVRQHNPPPRSLYRKVTNHLQLVKQ